MLQRCMDTYKMNGKLLVGIKVYENTIIHKVYVFIHKTGNYSNGINKSIDKCHYLHTQNKYILALINGLWEELNSHRQIPSCTCPQQCRCATMQPAREFHLEDQIIQLVTGLNGNFSVVKTQILLMDPLPNIK